MPLYRQACFKLNGVRFVSRWLAGQPYLTNSGVDDGAPNSLPQFPVSIPSGRGFQRDFERRGWLFRRLHCGQEVWLEWFDHQEE